MWVQSTPPLNMNQTWTFVMYASNRPSISQLFFEADGHRSSLNAIAWLWLRHYVEPVRNKPHYPWIVTAWFLKGFNWSSWERQVCHISQRNRETNYRIVSWCHPPGRQQITYMQRPYGIFWKGRGPCLALSLCLSPSYYAIESSLRWVSWASN